jgi:hypothetical protein
MGRPNSQTRKINLTVPDAVYEVLEELAKDQGRSTANLTAFAVEYFLACDAPKLYPFAKCLEKRDAMEDQDDTE